MMLRELARICALRLEILGFSGRNSRLGKLVFDFDGCAKRASNVHFLDQAGQRPKGQGRGMISDDVGISVEEWAGMQIGRPFKPGNFATQPVYA
jgi:hypothetical protein